MTSAIDDLNAAFDDLLHRGVVPAVVRWGWPLGYLPGLYPWCYAGGGSWVHTNDMAPKKRTTTALLAQTARGRRKLRRALAHNAACLGTVRTLNGNPAGGRAAYALSLQRDPTRLKSRLRWWATFLPRALFRRLL